MNDPKPSPRTPLKVAIVTFGAVVLVGTMISWAILSATGKAGDSPFARGQKIGQGVGTLGLICAVVAYLTQKRRLERK